MTAFPWARPGHCRDCEWLRQTYDTALAGPLKGDLESCPSSFRLYRTVPAGPDCAYFATLLGQNLGLNSRNSGLTVCLVRAQTPSDSNKKPESAGDP